MKKAPAKRARRQIAVGFVVEGMEIERCSRPRPAPVLPALAQRAHRLPVPIRAQAKRADGSAPHTATPPGRTPAWPPSLAARRDDSKEVRRAGPPAAPRRRPHLNRSGGGGPVAPAARRLRLPGARRRGRTAAPPLSSLCPVLARAAGGLWARPPLGGGPWPLGRLPPGLRSGRVCGGSRGRARWARTLWRVRGPSRRAGPAGPPRSPPRPAPWARVAAGLFWRGGRAAVLRGPN